MNKNKADSSYRAVINLLQYNGIKYSDYFLNSHLVDHPSFPSLQAISDVLNSYNLENESAKIEFTDLKELPLPFIANLKSEKDSFMLVTKMSDYSVSLQLNARHEKEMSLQTFKDKWTGIILVAENNKLGYEPSYNRNKLKDVISWLRIPALLFLLSILFFIEVQSHYRYLESVYYLAYCLAKVLGLFISVLLLLKTFNQSNGFIEKLCGFTARSGCDDVLNEPGSTLFGIVRWTDVGFTYFGGGVFVLFFLPHFTDALLLMSIACIPFTIYSLIYQYSIIKRWCTLCLLTLISLWIEAFIAFSSYKQFNHETYPMAQCIQFVAIFLLPGICLYVVYPYINGYQLSQRNKSRLKKIKGDNVLFYHLLAQTKKVEIGNDFPDIKLGLPNPNFEIIAILSPGCDHCGDMLAKIRSLLISTNGSIRVRMIFLVGRNSEPDLYAAAKHSVSLSMTMKNEDDLLDALEFWYRYKDIKRYLRQYPSENLNLEDNILEKYFYWSVENTTFTTPAIYVKNHLLPEIYDIEDLGHLIESSREMYD